MFPKYDIHVRASTSVHGAYCHVARAASANAVILRMCACVINVATEVPCHALAQLTRNTVRLPHKREALVSGSLINTAHRSCKQHHSSKPSASATGMENGIVEELEAMEAIYSRDEVEVATIHDKPGQVIVKMDKQPVLTFSVTCKCHIVVWIL